MSADAPQTETEKKEIPVHRLHAHKEGYVPDEEHNKLKEEEKKIDERKALRQAQWEKNPEMFIHQDEIVFGAVSTGENKYGILNGGYPVLLVKAAVFDILYRSFSLMQTMDLQRAMKQKGMIATPPDGGIIT